MQSRKSRFSRQSAPVPVQAETTSFTGDAEAFLDYENMTFDNISSDATRSSDGHGRKKSVSVQQAPKTLNKVDTQKLMDANRESAQSKAISEDNRGYKLLQKFGYCASQGGLGKFNSGLAVPLVVEKRDLSERDGLGMGEQKKRKLEANCIKSKLQEKSRESLRRNFESDLISQQRTLSTLNSLNAARKIIYELDFRSSVLSNILWPTEFIDEHEEVSDETLLPSCDSGISPDDQLKDCIVYLKDTYNYCIHCGVQYNDEADFFQNCPGPAEEDH